VLVSPATSGAPVRWWPTRYVTDQQSSLTPVPLAGRPVAPEKDRGGAQHRRAATMRPCCCAGHCLDDSPHGAAMFRTALRRLTGLAADGTHRWWGTPAQGPAGRVAGGGRQRPDIAGPDHRGRRGDRRVPAGELAAGAVRTAARGRAVPMSSTAGWPPWWRWVPAGAPGCPTWSPSTTPTCARSWWSGPGRPGVTRGAAAVPARAEPARVRRGGRDHRPERADAPVGAAPRRGPRRLRVCRPGSTRRTIRGWTTRRTTPCGLGRPPEELPLLRQAFGTLRGRCPRPG